MPFSTGTSGGSRLGLGLACVIASSVLALGALVYILVLSGTRGLDWLSALLVLAAITGAAGAFMLSRASRTVWRPSRATGPSGLSVATASPPAAAPGASPASAGNGHALTPPVDEVENLIDSFSRMLTTIEQQAQEINRYAVRLDSAYKEIETSSAQLKEFSFKDEVTGLYNRRFFSIRLEEEVSRYRRFNHPVSVVLLDLDGFKEINDEQGHASGDETLRGMAEILLKHSRGINVICRYGGDEFAVLLV